MTTTLRRSPAPCALAGLLLAACGDSPTDPLNDVVAGETEAALAVAERLPTLPVLSGRAISDPGFTPDPLSRAMTLWLQAEPLGSVPGARHREEAYRLAVPHLAAALEPRQIQIALRDVERWLEVAGGALRLELPAELRRSLAEGRRLHEVAGQAAERGDRAEAVEGILRAADTLRETTPARVASRLLGEATRRLERERRGAESDPASRATLERAERLVRQSDQALRDADYVLAIRRAYYAGRLLAELD